MSIHRPEDGQPPNVGGRQEWLAYTVLATTALAVFVSAAFGELDQANEVLQTGQLLIELWIMLRFL
ncbi:hypothetical protein [Streptomyces anulatus]|uniref:hypothetical protein n=1 Tax=Streptomyces anulatus TaxID=1892 RepID=UPI00363BF52C